VNYLYETHRHVRKIGAPGLSGVTTNDYAKNLADQLNRVESIGRINPTSQHHKREIRANNRPFDPDQTGNFTAPFPENPHQQPEFSFFCLFSGSPVSIRQ
jgi:hypothetical protein